MKYLFLAMFLLCAAFGVYGMEQQILVQETAPWWDKFIGWETVIAVITSLAGYVAGQHFKNHPKINFGPWAYFLVCGLVTGGLTYWMWPESYSEEVARQMGVVLGIIQPITVGILFAVMDKFFPGKGTEFKEGVWVHEGEDSDITKLTAVAVFGKKKDRRKAQKDVTVDRRND